MNTALYTSVHDAGMSIAHVCEVGVYLPDTSNVLGWIQTGVRTTLVECDPTVVAALRARFGTLNHVSIHDVAIADEVGMLTLYRTGASTFGSNVPSAPALVNDAYRPNERDAFMVQCVTFAAIDDGTIDVLSIDIEGGEWYVLKHMISRPHVISIETHGKYYVNPYMEQIDAWMQAHRYGAWYRDKSDTVFRLGWMEPVVDRTPPLRAFARFKRWLRGR